MAFYSHKVPAATSVEDNHLFPLQLSKAAAGELNLSHSVAFHFNLLLNSKPSSERTHLSLPSFHQMGVGRLMIVHVVTH